MFDQAPDPQAALRLTMVTGSLSRRAGGLFHSVRLLALALAARGHRISVIGLQDPDTDNDLAAWAPLQPIALRAYGPGWAPELTKAIDKTAPDVIHQHGLWLAVSASVAARSGHVPTVLSPRGMLDPWALRQSRWKKTVAWHAWEGRNLSRAAAIHALAEPEAEAIAAVAPSARIDIIPNAVELPSIPASSRTGGGPRTLLFLGRLHPKKGLASLLTQWAAIPADLRTGWRLRIVGPDEGGHRLVLQNLAEPLGITGSVVFASPVTGPAKTAELANADAFVLPSHSEGLPMSVLEAWALARPVFMTDACNLPDGFTQGAALRITTGSDPRPLRQALVHPDLPSIGQAGRRLVETRYTWDRVADRYEALYRSVIHSTATQRG